MFNLKVILLISCLIAVATAQSDSEVTGDARTKAVKDLKDVLVKVASKPTEPKYTFDDVDKVTKSDDEDGTQFTYELKLKKNNNDAKDCTVYLTEGKNFDVLTVNCPNDDMFSRIIF